MKFGTASEPLSIIRQGQGMTSEQNPVDPRIISAIAGVLLVALAIAILIAVGIVLLWFARFAL